MKIAWILPLLIVGGCASQKQNTASENRIEWSQEHQLSDEQEYYLGRTVSAHLLAHTPPIIGRINEYMTAIVMWMAQFSPRQTTFKGYKVALVDADEPIAVSAPGGFIFISRGMLQSFQNEDQLAGVLAHELAHIIARHGEKAIVQSMLEEQAREESRERQQQRAQGTQRAGQVLRVGGVLIGDDGGSLERGGAVLERAGQIWEGAAELYFKNVASYVSELREKGFSRQQEYEADRIAVHLLARSGYDPRELMRYMGERAATRDSGRRVAGSWTSTHPLDSERIQQIEQSVAQWQFHSDPEQRRQRFLRVQSALN